MIKGLRGFTELSSCVAIQAEKPEKWLRYKPVFTQNRDASVKVITIILATITSVNYMQYILYIFCKFLNISGTVCYALPQEQLERNRKQRAKREKLPVRFQYPLLLQSADLHYNLNAVF